MLTEVGVQTPVFARFSTVAGNRGSADLARDVRGFAVKFYTTEGNWDIVGNNIPVFFIQDAIKFPDLDPCGQGGARPRLPPGAVGARHLLGLDRVHARGDAHGHVADVRPHHPAVGADDAGLRRPQLPAGQRRGQVDLRQVPLDAGARHAVRGVGRGASSSTAPTPTIHRRDLYNARSTMGELPGVGPRRPAVHRGRGGRRSTSTTSTRRRSSPRRSCRLRVGRPDDARTATPVERLQPRPSRSPSAPRTSCRGSTSPTTRCSTAATSRTLDTQLKPARLDQLHPAADQRAEMPVRQHAARRPHADPGPARARDLHAEPARPDRPARKPGPRVQELPRVDRRREGARAL